eukprot:c26009_g1_i1 orf=614-1246(-)
MADRYGRLLPQSPGSSPRSDNESAGHGQELSSLREHDRLLPIANVGRIMKKALPANAKISKDAKETVQECVSEFISFVTGEASDKCQREKRKTVNGDDLLWAMTTLGFENYIEPLKLYLHKYRDMEGEKVTMAKEGSNGTGIPSARPNMAYPSGVHNLASSAHHLMPSQSYLYGPGMTYGSPQMLATYQMSAADSCGGSSNYGGFPPKGG